MVIEPSCLGTNASRGGTDLLTLRVCFKTQQCDTGKPYRQKYRNTAAGPLVTLLHVNTC